MQMIGTPTICHSRPTISSFDLSAAEQSLRSEMIAAGTTVKSFEEAFCKYIGGGQALAASSGKSALILALSTLGINTGDHIIVPTYVCKSVMDAILYIGAHPVIADIDENYCLSPTDIERKITQRTKAIIAVHIFGITANINAINDIGNKYNIRVIEDCAQAVGGEIDGRKLGSLSDMSFFSFHATKVMTTGEGGMVVVNAPELLDTLMITRQKIGSFFSMTDLQAALGLSQLRQLPDFIQKRKILAQEYIAKLSGVLKVSLPINDLGQSMFFRFPVRTRLDFDGLRTSLDKKGIHIRKGVDSMLHHYRPGGVFLTADMLYRETISLPIYPMLQITDIDYIASHFKTAVSDG